MKLWRAFCAWALALAERWPAEHVLYVGEGVLLFIPPAPEKPEA